MVRRPVEKPFTWSTEPLPYPSNVIKIRKRFASSFLLAERFLTFGEGDSKKLAVKIFKKGLKNPHYRLLAIDGSGLRMPANADDAISYFKNDAEDAKGYNLIRHYSR